MSEIANGFVSELPSCETTTALERDAQRLVASVLTLIRVSREAQRELAELRAAVEWVEAQARVNPVVASILAPTGSILEAFRSRPQS